MRCKPTSNAKDNCRKKFSIWMWRSTISSSSARKLRIIFPIKSLPEEERFTRLRTERKHFIDTIKMIAYRAETSLVSLLREHLARSDDARTLIRQIFETEADLLPDLNAKTLTVRIHHLTQAAHDQVLEKLCSALNETQTVFPGTDLTLFFKTGSS